MSNNCDYCDKDGMVVPFVGEKYKCPKCNGTKKVIGDLFVPAMYANESDEQLAAAQTLPEKKVRYVVHDEYRKQYEEQWVADESSVFKITGRSTIPGTVIMHDGSTRGIDPLTGRIVDPKEIAFERSLDPGDIWCRVFPELETDPNAEVKSYKLLRCVNEAIESQRISLNRGLEIAQLPLSEQEHALRDTVPSMLSMKTVFLSTPKQSGKFAEFFNTDLGKSFDWKPRRDNFLALKAINESRNFKVGDTAVLTRDKDQMDMCIPVEVLTEPLEDVLTRMTVVNVRILSNPNTEIVVPTTWLRRQTFGEVYGDYVHAGVSREMEILAAFSAGKVTYNEAPPDAAAQYRQHLLEGAGPAVTNALNKMPTLGEVVALLANVARRMDGDIQYLGGMNAHTRESEKVLRQVQTMQERLARMNFLLMGSIHQTQRLAAVQEWKLTHEPVAKGMARGGMIPHNENEKVEIEMKWDYVPDYQKEDRVHRVGHPAVIELKVPNDTELKAILARKRDMVDESLREAGLCRSQVSISEPQLPKELQ